MTASEIVGILKAALEAGYVLFAPVPTERGVVLQKTNDPSEISLEHILTLNTLKDVIYPSLEEVVTYRQDTVEIEPKEIEPSEVLIFGARPCDARSVQILDKVLLGDIKDKRYEQRRSQVTILTVACSKTDFACFCTSVGSHPHDTAGSDIILLPSQGRYLLRCISERGKEFLKDIGATEEEGEVDAPPDVKPLEVFANLKRWLDENFDNPKWEKVSENCLSCAICTYLCPTCHCFDIIDEAGLTTGKRFRIWDSCSFAEFTRMAGHQPRKTRFARYRQRIMHKFKYIPDNLGVTGCVGDGRCIRLCPQGIDIRRVVEALCKE